MDSRIAGNHERILVVDDDWMIREIIQAHLEGAGYVVMTAPSGEKALELAQTQPPDLVMLDLRMQGMSGDAVCAQLKAIPATRYTPVLMMTAMHDDEARVRALDAGADDFISKPFEALIMLTRVRSLLRIKRLQEELARREKDLWDVLNQHVSEEDARVILSDLLRSETGSQTDA